MDKNLKRIRVHMVYDWKEYVKDYPKEELIDENGIGKSKNSEVWHILLSNCHKYSNWIETAIENCVENKKGELMIMDDNY